MEAPAVAEVARVQAVVAESDDPEYWFSASKDGNREQHYRGMPCLECAPKLQGIYMHNSIA